MVPLQPPRTYWWPTMKTSMSRFQIHDDLTAPEGSVPVLRGALATGGQLPNFLGVLAGSPAALRAYARFRSELRHGKLTLATLERIALAVAEYYQLRAGHRDALAHGAGGRAGARRGGARAPVHLQGSSARRHCCATCRRCSRSAAARRCTSTRRPARRAGTTSRSWRRSRRSRSRASPRWSTSPARCRSTDRPKHRAALQAA